MTLLLMTLLACDGEDPAPEASTGCSTVPTVTWDGWAHGFFTTYCLACHSAQNVDQRRDAPANVDFDSEADVVALAARVRARVLDEGTMPIGGGVFPDDLTLLNIYMTCTLGE